MSESAGRNRPSVRQQHKQGLAMLYAILAYHVEADVMSWTSEQDATLMKNLLAAHERVASKAGLGPAARLGETRRALTLRNGNVIDGPFAETKEQLLGFYTVDCADEKAAVEAARELQRVNPGAVYEIRKIRRYIPGAVLPEA
jgi:hypothetical protein